MEIPKTINISFMAGLGDISMYYSSMDTECAYIIDLKRKHDVDLRAVICTVNNSVPDLFKYNPYFKEVSYHTWIDDHYGVMREQGKGHPYLHELKHIIDNLEKIQFPFFLSDEEAIVLKEITKDCYICLHLFAGDGERRWFYKIGHAGVERIVNTLLDCGHKVVLLGGTSERKENNRIQRMEEIFGYNHPDVYNLLSKYSVRLHCELVKHACAMVGTMSCYCSLATKFNTPIFVVAPAWQRRHFIHDQNTVFAWMREKRAFINYQHGNGNLDEEIANLQKFLVTL